LTERVRKPSSADNLTVTLAAPPTPTGLSVTGVTASSVSLAWSAAATAASYTLLRSISSGSGYSSLASGISATGFTDTTAAARHNVLL
jgi:chitodextrinase